MIKASIHLKKILKRVFIAFFILIALTSLVVYVALKRTVPVLDGKIKLSRLNSKEVKVVRDSNGIPHIEANNSVDAFRVLGYIVASERLFQMETQRRMAYGELSEIFGEKTLAMDRTFRSLGIKRQSEKIIAQNRASGLLDTQMMKEAEAFYDGVNQFQENGALPVEFRLLGITPKPFSLTDAHAFIGVMSYSFGMAMMQDLLMTSLSSRINSEKLEELRSGGPNKNIVTKKHFVDTGKPPVVVTDLLEQMQKGFPLFEGSNGWILDGTRTQSGFPILANDPHISYSHPGIWFEAHIKTPEYESYGHYLSVIPFPVHAHTRDMGWGFTMSLTDDMDFYREKINWSNNTYEFRQKNLPLIQFAEEIKVRGRKNETFMASYTHHGPVMDQVFEQKNLSLKWSYLEDLSQSKDLISVLYKMGRAKSMNEFKATIKEGKAPGLNILYADKKNIAWWMFGDIVIRPATTKSDFILDGASGEDEPIGVLKFEEKPFQENPASGMIVSANSRPANYPKLLRGDFQPDDRYETLNQILSQKTKWSLEELKVVQSLSMNFENKKILAELLASTEHNDFWKKKGYQDLLLHLKNWDFNSHKDSVAPLLFYSWIGHIKKIVLKDLSKKEFEIYSKIPGGSFFHEKILFNDKSAWWQGRDKEKILFEAFENAVKRIEHQLGSVREGWKWGRLHKLEFYHPLGALKPLNRIFNIGPLPMDGSIQEINNQRYAGLDFGIGAGPSTRRLIDFAHPEKALGILPTGNSAHILSPFYKDQLQRFVNGQYRGEYMDSVDYEQKSSPKLIFYSE